MEWAPWWAQPHRRPALTFAIRRRSRPTAGDRNCPSLPQPVKPMTPRGPIPMILIILLFRQSPPPSNDGACVLFVFGMREFWLPHGAT
jgi:hypothetical protein